MKVEDAAWADVFGGRPNLSAKLQVELQPHAMHAGTGPRSVLTGWLTAALRLLPAAGPESGVRVDGRDDLAGHRSAHRQAERPPLLRDRHRNGALPVRAGAARAGDAPARAPAQVHRQEGLPYRGPNPLCSPSPATAAAVAAVALLLLIPLHPLPQDPTSPHLQINPFGGLGLLFRHGPGLRRLVVAGGLFKAPELWAAPPSASTLSSVPSHWEGVQRIYRWFGAAQRPAPRSTPRWTPIASAQSDGLQHPPVACHTAANTPAARMTLRTATLTCAVLSFAGLSIHRQGSHRAAALWLICVVSAQLQSPRVVLLTRAAFTCTA